MRALLPAHYPFWKQAQNDNSLPDQASTGAPCLTVAQMPRSVAQMPRFSHRTHPDNPAQYGNTWGFR